ncbi:MAG: cysteine--tRNA ligase, partial [Acidimicrobiia bacterium]
MLRLNDTLQRGVVPFEPRDEGKVAMYVCGPTVQSEPHVGHGRSAVAFDAIRRYLAWRGYEVTFVRNV